MQEGRWHVPGFWAVRGFPQEFAHVDAASWRERYHPIWDLVERRRLFGCTTHVIKRMGPSWTQNPKDKTLCGLTAREPRGVSVHRPESVDCRECRGHMYRLSAAFEDLAWRLSVEEKVFAEEIAAEIKRAADFKAQMHREREAETREP